MADLESLTLLHDEYMDVESHWSLPSYFIILLSQNNYRYRIFNGWTFYSEKLLLRVIINVYLAVSVVLEVLHFLSKLLFMGQRLTPLNYGVLMEDKLRFSMKKLKSFTFFFN